MKIIGVGDNVVDYYKDRGEIFPGGNALNVAVLSKRYGAIQNAYMGLVGNDQAAEHVLQSLEQEKIDISHVRRAFGPNGEAIVSLNDEGDRVFVGSNKGGVQAFLKLQFHETDLGFIQTHDLLHTSVFSHIEHDLPTLSQAIPISFDFSTRRDKVYLQLVCPHIQYAFLSGSDLPIGECLALIETIHNLGCSVVGITRGEHGAIFSNGQEIYEQPIVETEVVDTLGAGDSFISMFLVQYHQEQNLSKAMQRAARAATETCKYYGAFGYGVKKR